LVGTVALVLSALAVPAQAQQLDSLQNAWMLPYPEETPAMQVARLPPGNSFNSPVAFGATWGTVYAGVGYQNRTRIARNPDGAAFVGFGVGDPRKWVGLDITVAALGTVRSFGRFGFNVKAHRRLPAKAAVAVGIENAAVIGYSDTPRSMYAVASKQFTFRDSPDKWFSSLTASLGAGNGRYVPEDEFLAGEYDGVNVFGSLGVRVTDPVGIIADWTGQDLVLGLSLVPFRRIPLVITPGFADVMGTAGDGARFVLGAAVGLYIPNSFRR
jgi:hypothetical protein